MIVSPWRTRAQNAFTRVESSANATIDPTPSAVTKNSVNLGCDAR